MKHLGLRQRIHHHQAIAVALTLDLSESEQVRSDLDNHGDIGSHDDFKSFLLGSQDLKVNLCGLHQDKCSDGKSKKIVCGDRWVIPTL